MSDSKELARVAAEEFLGQMHAALGSGKSGTVVLSGGSTPRGLYSLLAKEDGFRLQVPWEKIHFFWGDERHFPPNHPESNFRLAEEAMLSSVPAMPDHVHRIRSEDPDASQAAEEYEKELLQFFGLKKGQFPKFDLVLLGMGPDGHTASLFPGTEAMKEQNRLMVANWVPKLKTHRITMTLPLLNHAKCVLFLVSGGEKAEALRAVLEGRGDSDALPAKLVRPVNGRCIWLVDRPAARLLKTI